MVKAHQNLIARMARQIGNTRKHVYCSVQCKTGTDIRDKRKLYFDFKKGTHFMLELEQSLEHERRHGSYNRGLLIKL